MLERAIWYYLFVNSVVGNPRQPRFHVRANCSGCKSADPDFPFFDPQHGMYHLMFQFFPFHHPNPIIGHVASRDLVHWTRLPVALSNDSWWDRVAIWTGSATIVSGVPWLVYPGHCIPGVDGCSSTGFEYAQAVPADLNDPFYEHWRKLRPIVNDTFDDPSTAWRTPYGEWRFIGNSRIDQTSPEQSPIFAAREFAGPWQRVGLVEGLAWGECPSLYPLPALYPGTKAPPQSQLPSHVYKRSRQTHNCSGNCSGDMVQLGTWIDGRPGEVGIWQPTHGVPFGSTVIDVGNRYASKDFEDKHGRRINWGWTHIPGGGESLPRVQTYHPVLKRLIHSPLPELERLRGPQPLARLRDTLVKPDDSVSVWADPQELGRGNSSEIIVHFELPLNTSGRFGVRVMQTFANINTTTTTTITTNTTTTTTGDVSNLDQQHGVLAYVDFTAGSRSLRVGFSPPCIACSHPHQDLPLLPSEHSLSLRLFCDRTLVEGYWADGRVAMTIGGPGVGGAWSEGTAGGISLESSVDVVVTNATVFEMDSIWVPKEDI